MHTYLDVYAKQNLGPRGKKHTKFKKGAAVRV